MQKILTCLAVVSSLFVFFVFSNPAFAQGVLPPMPTDYRTATATATADQTATATPAVYRASTYTGTVTPIAKEVIDDAETGPVTALLIILSLIGGIGFILIKKYFDEKRYSL